MTFFRVMPIWRKKVCISSLRAIKTASSMLSDSLSILLMIGAKASTMSSLYFHQYIVSENDLRHLHQSITNPIGAERHEVLELCDSLSNLSGVRVGDEAEAESAF